MEFILNGKNTNFLSVGSLIKRTQKEKMSNNQPNYSSNHPPQNPTKFKNNKYLPTNYGNLSLTHFCNHVQIFKFESDAES